MKNRYYVRRLMDRMNNDWRRFLRATASEFFTGTHGLGTTNEED